MSLHPWDEWMNKQAAVVLVRPRMYGETEELKGLSYTRRVTLRKKAALAAGLHPATGMPLRTGLADSCGTCKHCVSSSNGNRHWYKCDLVPITASLATDIRLKWPACVKWEKEDADNT